MDCLKSKSLFMFLLFITNLMYFFDGLHLQILVFFTIFFYVYLFVNCSFKSFLQKELEDTEAPLIYIEDTLINILTTIKGKFTNLKFNQRLIFNFNSYLMSTNLIFFELEKNVFNREAYFTASLAVDTNSLIKAKKNRVGNPLF